MINKKRKNIKGIEFTILQKEATVNVQQDYSSIDENKIYSTIEKTIDSKIETAISNLPTNSVSETIDVESIIEKVRNDGLPFEKYTPTTSDFLSIVSNDPIDGSILVYDDGKDSIVWSNNLESKVSEIENKVTNYRFNFSSDHIISNKIHLPFAVKWTIPPYHQWGGQGNAGIFWEDPWKDPIDFYSIKMGANDSEIDEIGYSKTSDVCDFYLAKDEFGDVIVVDGELPSVGNSSGLSFWPSYGVNSLTMRFTNSTNSGRGWAWTPFGGGLGQTADNPSPRMFLTNSGVLYLEDTFISNKYHGEGAAIYRGEDPTNTALNGGSRMGTGAFHINGYLQAYSSGWSGHSIISLGHTDLDQSYDGYVLTYEHYHPRSSLDDALKQIDEKTGEYSYGLVTATTGPLGHLVLRPGSSSSLAGLSDVTITTPVSDGEVLTYDTGVGKWVNEPAGSGSDPTYSNSDPSTVTVGGIPAGTTFDPYSSMTEIFTAMFYPYQEPTFTSFLMASQSTSLECGDSIPVSRTFTWSTSYSSNVEPNTIGILDTTEGTTLASGLANDFSETLTISGSPLSKTGSTYASHSWRITGETTQGDPMSVLNFNVYWRWRVFYGTDTTSTASEALIEGLDNSSISWSSYARDYTCPAEASGYYWICWPTSFGTASLFMGSLGFEIPFQSPSTVSVTNSFGQTTDYYAYRSTYAVGSEETITVT